MAFVFKLTPQDGIVEGFCSSRESNYFCLFFVFRLRGHTLLGYTLPLTKKRKRITVIIGRISSRATTSQN